MEKSSIKSILDRVEKILLKNEKYMASDEIICACYLYRFMKYNDQKAYQYFKEIFNNLDDEHQDKAIKYYLIYARKKKQTQESNLKRK